MTKHPIPEWKAAASARADKFGDVAAIWWSEFRDAYAALAGLGDDLPKPPDADLQQYLRSLDKKVLQLRSAARNE
jgi:hypothetical protein